MAAPVIDPVKFVELCWPHIKLYDKQKKILYSVRDNDETFVPAGNGLGKDFISAIVVLWYFTSRRPCKIVTTSVQASQLNDVLWGEIRRLFDSSAIDLPLRYNHFKIRQLKGDGTYVGNSELVGQVISQGESLLGRHLARGPGGEPRTLAVFDEASGIDSAVYESADTWAHRKLIIGNPYPCTNFFYHGVKAGDKPRKNGVGFHRKVIKIPAICSPNIRYAMKEVADGKVPSGRVLIPGVVDYPTYMLRRETWPAIRQSIGLDAEFWEGADTLMYPMAWIEQAAVYHNSLPERRRITHIGIDPAEGGDHTVWALGDTDGLIDLVKSRTDDTTEVVRRTIEYVKKYKIDPRNILFDRGGGGKVHADRLRLEGYKVRTIAFGESLKPEFLASAAKRSREKTTEHEEEKYVYKNRRAEMYGMLRDRMDLAGLDPIGIPERFEELRRQLSLIPLLFDGEGRIFLPPKNRTARNSKQQTMWDILGCSPDELDATVLLNYASRRKATRIRVG